MLLNRLLIRDTFIARITLAILSRCFGSRESSGLEHQKYIPSLAVGDSFLIGICVVWIAFAACVSMQVTKFLSTRRRHAEVCELNTASKH